MLFRRVLYYWQFTAAILLPTWVVVGRGLFDSSMGWDLVLYIVLAPILAIAMLAVAAITTARKSVRDARALSWLDAALLTPWHLAVIAFGALDVVPLAAVIVMLAVAAFWVALWQLFTETRSRVKKAFALPDFPVESGHYEASPADAGRVIIVDPDSYTDTPPR